MARPVLKVSDMRTSQLDEVVGEAEALSVGVQEASPMGNNRQLAVGNPSVKANSGYSRNSLPFTVKLVRTADQLRRAVDMRASAYGRHVPTLGDLLADPEGIDLSPESVVFIAESKIDNEPVGTLRIQTNHLGSLALERSFTLPAAFVGRSLAGVTRLAVASGQKGRLVKLALFKALHRYCFATQVEWILIGARPPIDREYERLGFVDVEPEGRLIPFVTAGGVLHRVLGFEVFTAERRWFEMRHPLYSFMAQVYHPDIQIFSSVSHMWAQPRKSRRRIDSSNIDWTLPGPLV